MIGPRLASVDTSELEKFEKDLEVTRKKAFPFAVRQMLNDTAFDARREYMREAGESMKLRTKWTTESIRVDKATGISIPTMSAKVGSIEDYMKTQEKGATEKKSGTYGVPLPAAAPGKRKTRGRVGSSKRMGNVTLTAGPTKGSRQVRNAGAIAVAARKGGGDVFLNLGKRKGIFRVTPGKKRAARVRKIWDLSKSAVRIPRNSMLERAEMLARAGMLPHYREALIGQLRRHGALGY